MYTSLQKQSGFTIIELLVVIVVIGILAGISIVGFNGVQQRAAVVVLKSDLRNASTQLELYSIDNSGQYPGNASGLPKSEGTSYQYTSGSSAYCLTATSQRAGVAAYRISSSDATVQEGACPGHAGPGGEVANQPSDCPAGYIPVPGSATYGTQGGFCVMKYEARNSGGVATSVPTGTPWVSITQPNAISTAAAACSGCHLITEAEWLTLAQNVLNVASNWSGGAVGNGYIYSGHNDNSPFTLIATASTDDDGYAGTGNTAPSSQRRTLTLSNGEVIWDLAGNVWEWTDATITGNAPATGSETNFPNSWKQWNDPALSFNGLSTLNQLSNIGSSAPSWTSAQGIGQLHSTPSISTTLGYARGGRWSSAANAGVLALLMSSAPVGNGGAGYGDYSFRVTR